MTWLDLIQEATKVLSVNKFRSGLTILGIVIGISAIILMMSIGKGAESLILNEIGGMGAETIGILPGKEGASGGASVIFGDSLKEKDLDLLSRKENAPYITDIAPVIIVPGNVSFEKEISSPMIMGSSAEFFSEVFKIDTEEGFLFDESDIRQNSSVVVIGYEVAKDLFGNDISQATGEQITIKNRKFRVIGVFQKAGQISFFNFDELVIIPWTTAQSYLTGQNYFNRISLRAQSADSVERTVRDIEVTLRESHNIDDPKDDDFSVVTQQGIADQIRSIMGALTILLSSVVAIALVVGGIGVMNIMLVSVTERTREIGLRKALGATEKDILNQFLFEAVILTSLGGIIGILFGFLLSGLASFILTRFAGLNWVFVFPWEAALLGISVSVAVGLIFGVYPARSAAAKDPLEALRYE